MKRIRLEPEAYRLGHCFSVTIRSAEGAPPLSQRDRAGICVDALREAADTYEASVYAYCLMPGHAHILAAVPVGVSFVDFIRHFKQLSAFRLRRSGEQVGFWQSRFYDHALRSDEGLLSAARYVMENPVRAGLVRAAGDYPYAGSFVWDLSGSEDPDLHHEISQEVSVGG